MASNNKPKKGRWRQEGNRWVATVMTREDILTANRAARRQEMIDSGHRPGAGSGAHGGSKRDQRRRERRRSNDEARRGGYDE